MSHRTLVDLTISSDDERMLPQRPPSSKKPKVQHNGKLPFRRDAKRFDLTLKEQDHPYPQSGTLSSPFLRNLVDPHTVHKKPENGTSHPRAELSASNPLCSGKGPPLSHRKPQHPDGSRIISVQSLLNGNLLSSKPLDEPHGEDIRKRGADSQHQVLQPKRNAPIGSTELSESTPVDVSAQSQAIDLPSPPAIHSNTPETHSQPPDPSLLENVPLNLQSFQQSLQRSIHDLRIDHHYYVKSRLAYARHRHSLGATTLRATETTSRESMPTPAIGETSRFLQKRSPFASINPLGDDRIRVNPTEYGNAKLCQISSRVTKQGPEITNVPCLLYNAENITIPPFTNYISTKRNILIEDDKNRTFLPYHGDDANVDRDYAELESRITRNRSYYHHTNDVEEKARLHGTYIESFLTNVGADISQVLRYLLDETGPPAPPELDQLDTDDMNPDLAAMWQDREAHLTEAYYDSENSDTTKSRRHTKTRRPQKQWQAIFDSLPPFPTSRTAAAAGLACIAFANVMGFSLWHVVKRHRRVLEATSRKHSGAASHPSSASPGKESDPLGAYAELGCMVCYAHECPGHGAFSDTDDEKNIRIRINAKPPSPHLSKPSIASRQTDNDHVSISAVHLEDATGLNNEGIVSGKPWTAFKDDEDAFENHETCSDCCFWLKSNRSLSLPTWTVVEDPVCLLLPSRGPAMRYLYEYYVYTHQFRQYLQESEMWVQRWERVPHQEGILIIGSNIQSHGSITKGRRSSHAAILDHAAPPLGVTATSRKLPVKRHACVPTTAQGVSVGAPAQLAVNVIRISVELAEHMKYWIQLIEGKCTNAFVQRGVPRRTLLGHSKLLKSGGVSGWGLYMGEATKKGDYIGEYVGEVISKEESEQRGIIYNKRNLSYLFDLNSTQTLDSTLVGNKFRYINHQAPPYSNCQAKTLFCNTVHRIGMFACRNIEVGEEILFDYGEGFAAKFDLIKLDEHAQPRIEKGRKSISRRINKDPNKAPTLSKNGKRIGRPRKDAPSDQGVKEGAVMVETARHVKKADSMRKKNLKRKRNNSLLDVDEPPINNTLDEQLIPEEASEDPSSESFNESDDDDGGEFDVRKPHSSLHRSTSKRGRRTRMTGGHRKGGRGGRPRARMAKKQEISAELSAQIAALNRLAIPHKRAETAQPKEHANRESHHLRSEDPVAEVQTINDSPFTPMRTPTGQFTSASKGKERERESTSRRIGTEEVRRGDTLPKSAFQVRHEQVGSKQDGLEREGVRAGDSPRSSGQAGPGSAQVQSPQKRASKSSHRTDQRRTLPPPYDLSKPIARLKRLNE
ncbi:hypothetical protein MMC13_000579 [Lambiella insularis]|nr:hypothetical protein [Lambiella insularis]